MLDRATNSTATNVRSVVPGNLNLVPEIAKTTTFGAAFSPTFARGFNASIDFYDIRIRDAIASLSFQQTLDDCFAGSAASCGFVCRNAVTPRDSSSRSIW